MRTGREVMGGGRREDVRELWGRTSGGWVVEGRREGWEQIEQDLMTRAQKVKRVLCSSIQEILLINLIFQTFFILVFTLFQTVLFLLSTCSNLETRIDILRLTLIFTSLHTLIFYLQSAKELNILIVKKFYAVCERLCTCSVRHI